MSMFLREQGQLILLLQYPHLEKRVEECQRDMSFLPVIMDANKKFFQKV